MHSNLQKSVSINSPVLLYTPILFYVFPSKIPESNLNGIPVHGISSSLEKGGRVSKGVARSACSKWQREAPPHCNLSPFILSKTFGRAPKVTGFPPKTSQPPVFSFVRHHYLIMTYWGDRRRQKGWAELAPWAKAVQAQTWKAFIADF